MGSKGEKRTRDPIGAKVGEKKYDKEKRANVFFFFFSTSWKSLPVTS